MRKILHKLAALFYTQKRNISRFFVFQITSYRLSELFLLSGNIENIARKATVGYVLSGQKATLQDLLTYCDEETLSAQKSGRRIGFNV